MRWPGAVALAWLLVLGGIAGNASAQSAPRPGRIELGAGVGRAGGFDVGATSAELIGNGMPRGAPFPLFIARSRVLPAAILDVRVGVRVTPSLAVEGRLGRGRPRLRTAVSGDTELTSGARAESPLTRYEIEVGLVWHLTQAAFARGRALPYVGAGAGYLRELHEHGVGAQNGRLYHAAAGLKYRLLARPDARLKKIGLRGEVRLQVRDGGVDLGSDRRTHATVSVGLLIAL